MIPLITNVWWSESIFSNQELGTYASSYLRSSRSIQECYCGNIYIWLALCRNGCQFSQSTSGLTTLHVVSKTTKVSSSFAIDHFELFGLRQGLKMGNMLKFTNKGKIVTLFHYKWVRHPLMTGLFIMFWFTPVMTLGKFTHTRVNNTLLYCTLKVIQLRAAV